MKAANRCPEHYQGDRCKLPKNHEGTLHQGEYSSFEPNNEVETEEEA